MIKLVGYAIAGGTIGLATSFLGYTFTDWQHWAFLVPVMFACLLIATKEK